METLDQDRNRRTHRAVAPLLDLRQNSSKVNVVADELLMRELVTRCPVSPNLGKVLVSGQTEVETFPLIVPGVVD